MQFHCMIYFDPKEVFASTPQAQALLAAIGPHTAELTASGKLVLSLPLNLPQEAVTVKVREGAISTTDGPFMETKEVMGGFAMIEAKDLAEAIEIAATMPHASLGHVEVRPAIDFSKPRPQF
ncbi:YciI family protein [Devosia sp.]|uniref:YciI family protein n=1 Tax=Devosia sp. TaxID=1871048 RepID=UPI003BAB9AFB